MESFPWLQEGPIMREPIRWPALLGLGVALAVSAVQTDTQNPTSRPQADPDALAMVDLQERIDQYMKMHKEVARGPARLKEAEDPARISEAQEMLAGRIRAARKDARPGDIFTPQIREVFRRLMYPELRGPRGP